MKLKALFALFVVLTLLVLANLTLAQRSCYQHDVGYLKWLTVIREKPGLFGRAIRVSWSEDSIPVTNSVLVRGDCWAKSTDGWLLADNLTQKPVPLAEMHTMTSVRLPSIKGDNIFAEKIALSLSYLRKNAPGWYEYVTRPEYVIEPCGPCNGRSKAIWPERIVYIHEDTYGEDELDPQLSVARVLVHESCHIHQGVEGRWPRSADGCYAHVRVEQECVSRELEILVGIDIKHELVNERANTLGEPFSWWATEAVSSPPC